MTAAPFEGLPPGRFGAILADPPWAFAVRSAKGHTKSPENHYRTMAFAELAALPVAELAAPDCLLWIWATWPHLPTAMQLLDAWGFRFKTGGAWVKRTETRKIAFGTGYLVRSATEPFLLATRGAPKIGSRSIRNVIVARRREHSRKPPEARRMLEALRPGAPALELFAREPWPGHTVWGNDTGRFVPEAPAGRPAGGLSEPGGGGGPQTTQRASAGLLARLGEGGRE
jgi:N6-adenosine-specific RNA methylase IME4